MTAAAVVPARGWIKSSQSNSQGTCLEAGEFQGAIVVRNSNDPDGLKLRFSYGAWALVLGGVRAAHEQGEFPADVFHPEGHNFELWAPHQDRPLVFTPPEVQAAIAGMLATEFDLTTLGMRTFNEPVPA